MAIQLIFCLETNKRADTDGIYIRETINEYFIVNNQTKLNKVYMNSKTKYKSKDVLKEIEKKKKEFKIGQTIVIYCVDTDDFERDYNHARELQDICKFCKDHEYELVWFCHDIEDVFLGHKVSDSEKVKEAKAFRQKKIIADVNVADLTSDRFLVHKSNILNILNKYLDKQ